MIAFAHLLLLLLFPLSSQAVLHGREADHTLEECVCCDAVAQPECLVNLGPSANHTGVTDKTHQHLLFSTIRRELNGEIFAFEGGQIPTYAAGSLFKNGFGMFETEQYAFLSVFDAMGYALRVQLLPQSNAIKVTAKLTKTDWFNRSLAGKEIPPYRSFMGTDPPLSFADHLRLMTTIVPDNLNVNLVRQGDKLLGISDMDGFNELDFNTLDYRQYFRYSDGMSMTSSIFSLLGVLTSAHPISTASEPHIIYNFVGAPGALLPRVAFVPALATMAALVFTNHALRQLKVPSHRNWTKLLALALGVYAARWAFLAIDGQLPPGASKVNLFTIYRLDTSKLPLKREKLVSIPFGRFTYLHEMAITDESIVLMEWPTCWNIQSIATPLFNDPGKLQLEWHPELGTKITVVDKATGKVKQVVADALGPYWSYHHIGAYEKRATGELIIDACTLNSGEHLHTFEMRTLRRNTFDIPPNVNRRFIVNSNKGNATVRVLNVGPVGFDLPIRNPEYLGRAYKYAYGTGHRNKGEWWNTLVKVDMDTGRTWQWYEHETWPSQPVFVANPRRRAEDDGMLITVMLDGKRNQSFVLVLDAATMQEVARAYVDIVLPYTSHGYFDVEQGGQRDATTVPGLKNGFVPK